MLHRGNTFKIWLYILFLINTISKNNSYIVLPLEYLPKENYRFIREPDPSNEIGNIMKQIYFKRLITHINIGTPEKKQMMLIDTDSSRFYLSSPNPSSKSKKDIKLSEFYYFGEKLYFNETESTSYIKGEVKDIKYDNYDELWLSKDKINFNFGNYTSKVEFPIKLMKNEDMPIPGTIGLNVNNSHSYYLKSFLSELKLANLINDYYYFFDFSKWSPLDYNIKCNLIIGDLPHNVFPEKYSKEDYVKIQENADSSFWTHSMKKIVVGSKTKEDIQITNTKTHFFYEFYNVIGTPEFRNEINELFFAKLIKEKKCFKGKFSQNIYSTDDLFFYYCNIEIENILLDNIYNIKFISKTFGFTFELTKNELYYKQGKYIYFTILFFEHQYNNWILGQMFTSKYHFVFHTDSRQISFYKKAKINEEENIIPFIDNKNNGKIWTFIILISFVFIFIGIIIGIVIGIKFLKNKQKRRAQELIDEDYDYTPNNENHIVN